jgi:hypothetical protein
MFRPDAFMPTERPIALRDETQTMCQHFKSLIRKRISSFGGANVVPRVNNSLEHLCCETKHASLKAKKLTSAHHRDDLRVGASGKSLNFGGASACRS